MQEDLTNEYYHVNTSELKYKQVEAAALANTFNSAADKLESYYGKSVLKVCMPHKNFGVSMLRCLSSTMDNAWMMQNA